MSEAGPASRKGGASARGTQHHEGGGDTQAAGAERHHLGGSARKKGNMAFIGLGRVGNARAAGVGSEGGGR